MNSKLRIAALAAATVLQLAVLAAAIPFEALFFPDARIRRLEVGLVDPLDLMRGRFVQLDFPGRRVLAADLPSLAGKSLAELEALAGDDFYCLFAEAGPDGFSVMADASPEKPRGGQYYLRGIGLAYADATAEGIALLFDFPFDRYYLQEDTASRAERILAETGAGAAAALIVRVAANGEYAVEGLEIDGVAIEMRAADDPEAGD